MRALSGGGDYVHEVRQRERSPLVYAPASGKRHPPVAVRDGQAHVTGVRVKIRYERLAISGRLSDAAGKPVADATVSARPQELGWYTVPSAITDERGVFAIRDLPAGSYTVQATSTRGEARAENVAAGRTDVELRVLEPSGIDGTLTGFSGKPTVTAYRVEDGGFARYRATVNGTTFQLRNLPAGTYRVSAQAAGQSASTMAELEAGTIQRVTLGLRETGVIAGRVIDDKTRAPLAGLTCMSRSVADDVFDDEAPAVAKTDTNGTFRLERALVGAQMVACHGDGAQAWSRVSVTAGQVAQVELVATKRARPPAGERARAGLTLENQLSEVFVKSVEAEGPAARAGVAVGDVLVSVDGKAIGRYQAEMAIRLIEMRGAGAEASLVLERNDKQITVVLKLDRAPTPAP